MLLAEQSKERGRLQRGVPAELGRDPGPVLLKGVRSRQGAARLLELVGGVSPPLVPAHCLHAHSCLCSRLFLGSSLGTFAFHQKYLRVALHGASSFWHHVMATRRGSTQQVILIVAAGKSNCRSSVVVVAALPQCPAVAVLPGQPSGEALEALKKARQVILLRLGRYRQV